MCVVSSSIPSTARRASQKRTMFEVFPVGASAAIMVWLVVDVSAQSTRLEHLSDGHLKDIIPPGDHKLAA